MKSQRATWDASTVEAKQGQNTFAKGRPEDVDLKEALQEEDDIVEVIEKHGPVRRRNKDGRGRVWFKPAEQVALGGRIRLRTEVKSASDEKKFELDRNQSTWIYKTTDDKQPQLTEMDLEAAFHFAHVNVCAQSRADFK
jgi:hypothetical protein